MPRPLGGDIKRWCCLTSDVCLTTSVAHMRPKSRTERPRKTKIGTEVAHVTRDSDTTFKVNRSKVKVTGRVGILWLSIAQLVLFTLRQPQWATKVKTRQQGLSLSRKPEITRALVSWFRTVLSWRCFFWSFWPVWRLKSEDLTAHTRCWYASIVCVCRTYYIQ